MNIEQNNILLAEFLGYSRKVVEYEEQIWNSSNEYYWDWTEGELWCDEHGEPVDDETDELKFHYDWNELMKVLDKIRSYPTYNAMEDGSISIERFQINNNSMYLSFYKYVNGKGTLGNSYHEYFPDHKEASDSESYIEMVFKCCVDFVKFING